MRILYLSQLIPYPADAGPKVRSYRVLQHLAKMGHQVTLLAFHRESDRPEDVNHLAHYCTSIHTVLMQRGFVKDIWHMARSQFTQQPFLISRDGVAEMYGVIERLLASETFDAIHADQLWMAQYALAAKVANGQRSRVMTVLDQHNAVFLIPQRMALGRINPLKRAVLEKESFLLAKYEAETCARFDEVVWVTEEDKRAVGRLGSRQRHNPVSNGQDKPVTKHTVIPICIDPEEKPVLIRKPLAHRVTFLGGLHWPPNADGVRWFAREVWPEIRQHCPDAIFTVIGKDPPSELSEHHSPVERIEVTGYVTDPTPYLEETAAFIVPLGAGGGMRVKILDGWAWGLPVVSTRIGAEGIDYKDGENLLIADSANDFSEAVVSLFRQPEIAARIGAAGRNMAVECYDWRHVYRAWNTIYGESDQQVD